MFPLTSTLVWALIGISVLSLVVEFVLKIALWGGFVWVADSMLQRVVIVILVVAVFGGGLWFLMPWYLRLFHAAENMPRGVARVGLGTFVVFLLALGLFLIKVTRLRMYSLIEIVFSLVMCMNSLGGMQDDVSPVQMLSLMASAYLMIRGMDNFKKDLDERKKEHHVLQPTS